jgi:hypothetical protein
VRIFFYLLLFAPFLFAEVHYAKVEPYKIKNITANVSGRVVFVNEDLLGKTLSNRRFIHIDDVIDKAELRDVNKKLSDLHETLLLNKKILKNLAEVLKRKKINYKKTEALKIKSRIDKDKEFYDLIATKNSYNTTQKEINTLQNSIADLELQRTKLRKSIHDKSIIQKGFLLYSLKVKEGTMVNMATPLAEVADISKALLTIYVDRNELAGIEQKKIYLNDHKTNYKIRSAIPIADSVNISKYRVQIVINPPKIFSQLVKVELKEE